LYAAVVWRNAPDKELDAAPILKDSGTGPEVGASKTIRCSQQGTRACNRLLVGDATEFCRLPDACDARMPVIRIWRATLGLRLSLFMFGSGLWKRSYSVHVIVLWIVITDRYLNFIIAVLQKPSAEPHTGSLPEKKSEGRAVGVTARAQFIEKCLEYTRSCDVLY
jgi:hypothetical protein